MASTEKVDILIIGGGPVGLFFAYQMANYGHTFYLCDKKSGPTTETRALTLAARTMEVLENHDIAAHIIKDALVLHGTQMYIWGKKLGVIDSTGDTKFSQLTTIPQGKTEAILSRLVGEDKIHRETELVKYEQNGDGVVAIVRDMKDGSEKRIHAQYIIGADGSHSSVRKLAKDWAYEGFAMATKLAVCDALVTGVCGMIPAFEMNGHIYHRIFVNFGLYEADEASRNKESTHGLSLDDNITLEEMQKLICAHIYPLEVEVTDPQYLSIFRINERIADGFRRNRAFLVGDAAHCHSPFGGQGLNIGFQDAENLAWKLSLVLNGLSSNPEKLLDSYSIERKPIAAATLRGTGFITRLGLVSNAFLSSFMRLLLPFFLSWDTVRQRFAQSVMQIGTRLPKESILILQPSDGAKDLIQPGEFIRDTTFLRRRIISEDAHFDRRSLHQIIQSNKVQHTIIWLASRPARLGPSPWTQDFWSKFNNYEYPKASVRALVVESVWHTHRSAKPPYVATTEDAIDHWIEEQWDVQNSISKRIGLAGHMKDKPELPAAIVIVRPDLYVSYSYLVRSPGDIDHALKFLDGYLLRKVNLL
ncbi:FAD binding domain-containing protein [Fennellomyces sp. T-0311]|nr:FAD binding domain-containing protein [Fennellomyces sp. T-0311]